MIKIYILLDEYLNSEYHTEFVEAFDNAEELARYMEDHQEDGHKFKIEIREFMEKDNSAPSSPWPWTPNQPWTVPSYPQPIDPLYPQMPIITWQNLPCFNGGECTNPQRDCINCPHPYGTGQYRTTTSTGNANDIKLINEHRTTSNQ